MPSLCCGQFREVIRSYANRAAEIFPADVSAASYKNFKMLQLIELDHGEARIPAPESGPLKEFRENMGEITLKALRAAAKSATPALHPLLQS